MRMLSLLLLLPQCILASANDDETSSSLRRPKITLSSSSTDNVATDLQSDSETSQFGGAYSVNDVELFSGNLRAESGLTISRTIDTIDDKLSLTIAFVHATCDEEDEYGNNNCHYNWGDDLNINVTLNTNGVPFGEGDNVVGKFKVDYIIPWRFDCQICGADCTLSLPVIDQGITIPGPACPYADEASTRNFDLQLGKVSPVHGITTHFSGHMTIKKSGTVVARISIEAIVV